MNTLHAAVADSSAAFAAQIDSHRSCLLRTARLKVRDHSEAEDVVQDTLIAAWNGRAGFRGQSTLRTWLVGILNHKIVDLIRERQRRPAVSFDEIAEFLGEGEHADAAGFPHAAINEGVAMAYERRRLCENVLDELEAF
jgi:RNA polymerase sigma-70 factor (ECF subfamily)